jgi:uncharacterized protein YbjT (DUF2867 family)
MYDIDWNHGDRQPRISRVGSTSLTTGEKTVMFIVLGATGNTGSVVVASLLAAGKKVRVLVRDAAKASTLAKQGVEVVTGDVQRVEDVTRALTGAEGAYLVLPPDAQAADPLAKNRAITEVLRAALEATKVPHAVLLSSIGAQHAKGNGPIAALHHAEQTLGALKATRFTFLRAAYFLENLAGMLHPMKADGVLPVLSQHPDRKVPMVATRDIGETAARALLEPPAATEIVELSGPAGTSFADAARAFGKALGREVSTVVVPYEGIVPALTAVGIGAPMAALYREMSEGLDAGIVAYDGKGRRLAGKIDVDTFARAVTQPG